MKKTILTILICGVMILGITGCGNKNEFDVGSKSDITISQEDVSLTIKDGTLKNTGATLILKNNSNKNFQYGNPYRKVNQVNSNEKCIISTLQNKDMAPFNLLYIYS